MAEKPLVAPPAEKPAAPAEKPVAAGADPKVLVDLGNAVNTMREDLEKLKKDFPESITASIAAQLEKALPKPSKADEKPITSTVPTAGDWSKWMDDCPLTSFLRKL